MATEKELWQASLEQQRVDELAAKALREAGGAGDMQKPLTPVSHNPSVAGGAGEP